MTVELCVNSDYQERTWTTLQNADTGETLQLEPQETANVDLPDGFGDPWLKVVPPSSTASDAEVGSVVEEKPASRKSNAKTHKEQAVDSADEKE